MVKKYASDMTNGNIISLITKFTVPLLIGNVFQQLYNLVDSSVVGKMVGTDALAAVGVTNSITLLLFSLCFGLSIGCGILIGQYFGAMQFENLKNVIVNSIILIICFGIVLSLAGCILSRSILEFMKVPKKIIDDSVRYFQIVCFSTAAVGIYNVIASILKAIGDSVSSLVFLILSSILNIVLDVLFVVVLKFGVSGAAAATVISQITAAVGITIFAFEKNPYFILKKCNLRPRWNIIGKCISLGLPVAIQDAMICISCLIMQRYVNHFGTIAVATYTVTTRLEQLIQQPYISLGVTVSTFTAQNIGAKKDKRVLEGYKKAIKLVAVVSIIFFAVIRLFSYNILGLFVEDYPVIALGTKAFHITSVMFFPMGMIFITRGLLNGSGDSFFSMISGVVEFILRIGLLFCLNIIFKCGIYTVWYTTACTWCCISIINFFRFRVGKWRTQSLVS